MLAGKNSELTPEALASSGLTAAAEGTMTLLCTAPPDDRGVAQEMALEKCTFATVNDSVSSVADRCRRLNLPLTATSNLRLASADGYTELPHLMKMLLSTAIATEHHTPICIILPSVERVAETIAILASIECLAADLPGALSNYAASLKVGSKVRLYPTGEIFEIAGKQPDGSLRLLMKDKKTRVSNGTKIALTPVVVRFEPTTRDLPHGTQYTTWSHAPAPNALDLMAGAQAFGNSGLNRTRVLLAGTRSEFQRTLNKLPLIARQNPAALPLPAVFHYGGIDHSGMPFVIAPAGSAGQPLVAIERDLLDLEAACLKNDIAPSSRLVITDRVDMVMRDLDLAGRIAERQRLILFVEARRRGEVEGLTSRGWTVWEPGPSELLGALQVASSFSCEGIDVSLRGAEAELVRSPGFLAAKAPQLAEADAALTRIGGYLGHESVEHDPWFEDLLETLRGLFFKAAGWLSGPAGVEREETLATVQRTADAAARVESYLGSAAGAAVRDFTASIAAFVDGIASGAPTDKGGMLLRLAKTAIDNPTFTQIFVAGSRQSREETDAFFQAHGLPVRCVAVRDLKKISGAQSVVAFSVIRRELFERLVDPWPSAGTLFVGYDFETACYERRLSRRHSARMRHSLPEIARASLTGLPPAAFPPTRSAPTSARIQEADNVRLNAFDRVTREWGWIRRITIPTLRQGEEACDARIVRFAGRSWCAMTDDHETLLFTRDAGEQALVHAARLAELAVGDRIIVREGGDRDVIRMLAEARKGETGYAKLREAAALWRRAILAVSDETTVIRRRLDAAGMRRNPVTIRSWIKDEQRIGPRSTEDIEAIARAFPFRRASQSDWKACDDAIRELRALHIGAGSQLTEMLAERCGQLLFEPSETELAIDLGFGTVWVLEVSAIDDQSRECPATYVNRLQWLEPAWKNRLLAAALRSTDC